MEVKKKLEHLLLDIEDEIAHAIANDAAWSKEFTKLVRLRRSLRKAIKCASAFDSRTEEVVGNV